MKTIELGKCLEQNFVVEEQHSAKSYGSGFVNVLSTPALIGFMEKVCNELLIEFLDENEVSVGIEVNVKHLKATKIGDKIKCTAIIIETEKNKVTFKVEAYDSNNKIGEGTHKRAIISKEKIKF
ncbi:MAG: thioesterase family protein [Bacteroidales bacterium]|nr:thioesterase family protein [Bacteroidales bacterium]